MTAGYSGTPLVRKLGIRSGARVAALNPPDHLADLLQGLPDGARLESEPTPPSGLDAPEVGRHDVVLLFCRDAAVLEHRFGDAHRLLAWDGGLWVCWPKGSSTLASDLGKGDVRRRGLDAGLVDNKVCAVDEDWSGLRFVYRREDRPG